MGQTKSKVMPAHQKLMEDELERWSRKKYIKKDRRVYVMLLRVLLNRYGGYGDGKASLCLETLVA